MRINYGYNKEGELCLYIPITPANLDELNTWFKNHETLICQVSYKDGVYTLRKSNPAQLEPTEYYLEYPHAEVRVNYVTNQVDLLEGTRFYKVASHLIQLFLYKHLSTGAQKVSKQFYTLAIDADFKEVDNPLLTHYLYKLKEAKDYAVACTLFNGSLK